jgi:hypothetical protein
VEPPHIEGSYEGRNWLMHDLFSLVSGGVIPAVLWSVRALHPASIPAPFNFTATIN